MKEIVAMLPILICSLIPVGVIAALIWYEVKIGGPARRIREEEKLRIFKTAQEYYFNALAYLKDDPTNADIKQQALNYGREFAEITRRFQGMPRVTLFDEVALMNDINAACAGATAFNSENAVKSPTVGQRLAKLNELKEMGLLKEQEYEERRQKILDEI